MIAYQAEEDPSDRESMKEKKARRRKKEQDEKVSAEDAEKDD